MRFKVGDKIRFLNETGGGMITALIDNKLVKVETEDGFEIPVLSKDLIPDFRKQEAEQIILSSGIPPKENLPKKEEFTVEVNNISEINPWGRTKEEEGFYLLFEPHELQWILTGNLDVVLANHTPFDILYNLFLKQNDNMQGVDYGSVPPNSKIILATITRDEITRWLHGIIQILIHKTMPEKVFFPIHSFIDIRENRFFKEGSYQTNTLTNGKAIISVIALRSTFREAVENAVQQKFDTEPEKTKTAVKCEIPFIEKFRTDIGEAVVDLHIGKIVDNITGLESRDMFQLQMNYFKKALESAIAEGYHKITFIHGVGNGILKNAIIKELEDYEHLEGSMASIIKFGVGALDVSIDKNKK
ncbi:MAG: mannonate oxidoreductase [bacterium]|nr:MAG: mannonate oxidoreductase [bacterium]